MMRVSYSCTVALNALLFSAIAVTAQNSTDCKCIPGDACWPAAEAWAELNTTVSGKLIANKPLAHVCHDPDYDEAACTELKSEWVWPLVFQDAPTAMMDPVWQNCTPYTPREQPCELGQDAVYSINVTSASDMAAGVKFAAANNIRLVVRNTGHDFLGKSTGTGSLSLWTHNMRDIALIRNYTDPSTTYTGPALKLAAGVRGTDALSAASASNLVALVGNCPTVGLVGGWTQGGGHSALSSTHGMGADQVLAWDVVTAAGALLTATPTEHPDLYWAMSGGGPGAYAVAAAVTIRVFPDQRVGGAALAFASPAANSSSSAAEADAYWNAVRAFLAALPQIVDLGGHVGFSLSAAGFRILPLTLPGADEADTRAAMAPFVEELTALGVPFSYNVTSFATFEEHYDAYLGPIPRGTMNINVMMGGRLVPREVVERDNGTAVAGALRELRGGEGAVPGLILAGVAMRGTDARRAVAPNALLPQWRGSLVSVLAAVPWDFAAADEVNRERERALNEVVVPRLEALTPGSGTYLNEASYLNPNWKEDYYGVNYERLREVKGAWDPEGLFYGPTMVGSDEWVERDGRLCRV
ncbi:fad binding domain protein [Diplodia corticola]|uniref:Fad binding domain protein n=1 Tax=Diplodia corticola TaxID=236234 RepID=A0A1J9R093_9PEZI|nr:fad binding domain protein [Diplodia corticola]OJD34048.1 fad binding domain protein [Diplodia corticola]